MAKQTQDVTMNNHLSLEELINKYDPSTELFKSVKKNLNRSMERYYDQKGIDQSTMELDYHYFKCPITGLNFCEVSNNHFKRFGITKERFLELFPEYKGITETPYASKFRRTKAKEKQPTPLDEVADFDETSFNKTKLLESLNVGTVRKQMKKHGADVNNLTKNYHYFLCPLTGGRILGFTPTYFKKTNDVGITKEMLQKKFPEHTFPERTPFVSGVTIEDFRNGNLTVKPRETKATRRDAASKFKDDNPDHATRNMHLTLGELYSVVSNGNDAIITQYMHTRNSTDAMKDIREELGVDSDNDLESGYHYFIHPLSCAKVARIDSRSIEPFGITEAQFFEHFPDFVDNKMSPYSIEKMRNSLMEEDEHGVSSMDRVHEQRKAAFSEVGEDGLTLQERTTAKTRDAHMTTIDEYGRNGYQCLADDNIEKSIVTKNQNASERDFERYRMIVLFVMAKLRPYFHSLGITYGTWKLDNYDAKKHHQVDHKFSMYEGFNQGISPLCIANVDNIEVLTGEDNVSKRTKCSITLDELAQLNGMTIDEMCDENDRIMSEITSQVDAGVMRSSMNTLINAGTDLAMKMKTYNEIYHEYVKYDSENDLPE